MPQELSQYAVTVKDTDLANYIAEFIALLLLLIQAGNLYKNTGNVVAHRESDCQGGRYGPQVHECCDEAPAIKHVFALQCEQAHKRQLAEQCTQNLCMLSSLSIATIIALHASLAQPAYVRTCFAGPIRNMVLLTQSR